MIRHVSALLALAILVAYAGEADAAGSPRAQLMSGVSPHEIECRDGLVLAFRGEGGAPACLRPQTLEVLSERGWIGADSAQPNMQGAYMQDVVVVDTQEMDTRDAGDDTPADIPPIPADLADANNAFAVDFYRDAAELGENLFFSPTSMHMAFSILYEGARYETAAQIERVFGIEPDDDARHDGVNRMMESLNRDDPDAVLEMANSLWIADWFEPDPGYTGIVRDTYMADAYEVDFTGDGLDRINGWADEKTHGKIKEILTKGDVGGSTAMAILNAIYFKGSWVTQFPEDATEESEFWTDAEASVDADLMHVTGSFEYAKVDGAKVIRLPYEGDRLSMMVVLPDERDGIGALEEDLSAEIIREWGQGLALQEVRVSMPKFTLETKYDLMNHVKSLGAPDMFDPGAADLLGILGIGPEEESAGGGLYVSRAIQKAYVDVNEEGTEAAAVTAIVISESVPPEPPHFRADHPFVFMIVDDESGMILFMGRVSVPTA